ncbi:MAG: SGNH/GDSL hydrolase family protein [Chitinophagaceae bacterium]|nr:SGNH/GDSL hydrolase family protein [Chitinophagaceae bacterium]MCW5925817.1 SGNH/GDSL hydrolase family protein [Chitinophagaceae bacterium]
MKRLLLFATLFVCLLSFAPKKKTWVAIGDSITYLNDHLDETGNRVTKGYMTLVTEKLPHIQYVNQGHNGWTSGGIADKIETLGIQKADIYTIFLGTNDWWQGRPVGTIEDYTANAGNHTVYGSFRIIIDKLCSLNPKAKIVLITPMQRGDFVYLFDMKNNAWGSYREKNGQTLAQFADAVVTIGRLEKIPVADLYNNSGMVLSNMVKYKRLKDPVTGGYKNFGYPAYTTIPFNPETDEYPYPVDAMDMTYDGLHPSDAGYVIIAKKLITLFKKY